MGNFYVLYVIVESNNDVLPDLKEESLNILCNINLFCAQYTFLPRLKAGLAQGSSFLLAGMTIHQDRGLPYPEAQAVRALTGTEKD